LSDIIDCSLHPLGAGTEDVLHYLGEPWKRRGVAYGFQKGPYHPPIGRFSPKARSHADDGLPASDPSSVIERFLDPSAIDVAVLLPLTFGLVPEVRFDTALTKATNNWLAEHWLDPDANRGRFKGTIRVNPRDVRGAIEQIERWAGHPGFVQIAVPLESHAPYGQEAYFPIWEAAVAHNLPVAFHSDGWAGAQFPPTGAGYPSLFLEAHVQQPLLALVHLSSMIVEGVLDRLPGLRLVFADGGFALFEPMMWRIDRDWRSLRFETPWIDELPSAYLRRHVRVVLHKADVETDGERMAAVLNAFGGSEILIYGSNFPFWDTLEVDEARASIPADDFRVVLMRNAAALYGDRQGIPGDNPTSDVPNAATRPNSTA
jgi:predicted TIM-barrel fold metal-dependent hydrolase